MTLRINLQRYTEDRECATPEGLKARMMRDLIPVVRGIQVQRNRVIVATYVRPNITRGGIIMTDKSADEDRWQGKAGLLLKRGPVAFEYDEVLEHVHNAPVDTAEDVARYQAERDLGIPQIGDWVMFRNSETWEIGLCVDPATGEAVSARVVADDSILAVVNDPSAIF